MTAGGSPGIRGIPDGGTDFHRGFQCGRAADQAAIWARVSQPSLSMMCCTWVSTVRTEMTRAGRDLAVGLPLGHQRRHVLLPAGQPGLVPAAGPARGRGGTPPGRTRWPRPDSSRCPSRTPPGTPRRAKPRGPPRAPHHDARGAEPPAWPGWPPTPSRPPRPGSPPGSSRGAPRRPRPARRGRGRLPSRHPCSGWCAAPSTPGGGRLRDRRAAARPPPGPTARRRDTRRCRCPGTGRRIW